MNDADDMVVRDRNVDFLGFYTEEKQVIEILISGVRSLLIRTELSPQLISQIGIFLFGLERLPLSTPGISMSLTLEFELNRERDWLCINIEDDRFVLERGIRTSDPLVGNDHHIEIILETGYGCRDGDTFKAMQFAENFSELATDPTRTVSITQNSDDPFNGWGLKTDSDDPFNGWGKPDSEYI